jgi:hypothetical protein
VNTKYAKMDPAVKRKWLKALRSGKYRQCKRTLTDGHGSYCCLGVLGRVVGDMSSDEDLGSMPSDGIRERVNLSSAAADKLSVMNDRRTASGRIMYDFKKIADWIEEKL